MKRTDPRLQPSPDRRGATASPGEAASWLIPWPLSIPCPDGDCSGSNNVKYYTSFDVCSLGGVIFYLFFFGCQPLWFFGLRLRSHPEYKLLLPTHPSISFTPPCAWPQSICSRGEHSHRMLDFSFLSFLLVVDLILSINVFKSLKTFVKIHFSVEMFVLHQHNALNIHLMWTGVHCPCKQNLKYYNFVFKVWMEFSEEVPFDVFRTLSVGKHQSKKKNP